MPIHVFLPFKVAKPFLIYALKLQWIACFTMCFFGPGLRHRHRKKETKKRKTRTEGKHIRKDQRIIHKDTLNITARDSPSSMAHQRIRPMTSINGAVQCRTNPREPHNMTCHSAPTSEVYIYPKSMPQVSFPVVDYKPRGQTLNSIWPTYYMAMAPSSATPEDIEAELAPPGSGLTILARLPDFKTASLGTFRDASDIRNHSLQLEIYEAASLPRNVSTLQGEGTTTYGPHNHGCHVWKPHG